jgi:hypothetical protein
MSQPLRSVLCSVTALVSVAEDRRVPLPARLRYERSDPYAVRLSLGDPACTTVDWVFARDLLAEGVRRPAGTGDVLVLPRHRCLPDTLRVVLRSRVGAALVELPVSLVTGFLQATYGLVAPGTEGALIDLEGALARLAGRSD